MIDRHLRRATPEDIVGYLVRAERPVSNTTILSGMGMGDAQIGIAAALNEALDAGLIRVSHTEPGPLHIPYTFYVPVEVTR